MTNFLIKKSFKHLLLRKMKENNLSQFNEVSVKSVIYFFSFIVLLYTKTETRIERTRLTRGFFFN